jgi:hypothetical protein
MGNFPEVVKMESGLIKVGEVYISLHEFDPRGDMKGTGKDAFYRCCALNDVRYGSSRAGELLAFHLPPIKKEYRR